MPCNTARYALYFVAYRTNGAIWWRRNGLEIHPVPGQVQDTVLKKHYYLEFFDKFDKLAVGVGGHGRLLQHNKTKLDTVQFTLPDSTYVENCENTLFYPCERYHYPHLEKHRLCNNSFQHIGQLYLRSVDQGFISYPCCPDSDNSCHPAERAVLFSRVEQQCAQRIRGRTSLRAAAVSSISRFREPQYRCDVLRDL